MKLIQRLKNYMHNEHNIEISENEAEQYLDSMARLCLCFCKKQK
jgi:uncharacterized protein (DUF2164 family)